MTRRQALRITAVAGVSLAMAGALVAELVGRARLHRVRLTRVQLGTRVTVTVVHPDPEAGRAMVDATFAEIERLEGILSRHRRDTPLSRLNREGGLRDAPPELTDVLRRALDVARLTEGAFDPTVAPLLELHRTRFDAGRPPSDSEVREALSRVGWRHVRLEGAHVVLERPGVALTLDGIAKGHVVDRAAATLMEAGADRVMVDAGGDVASAGAGGDPWHVAVRDPRSGGSAGVLALRGGAVASSGDYLQAFTVDRLHHHILDPRTGRSPLHTSAVSVVAPKAMDADALSTAAFVLGPEEGLRLLEATPGVEGLLVTKDQRRIATRGFARHLV